MDTGLDGPVYCLTTYQGELYAGGHFQFAGSTPCSNIAKWNGTSWSAVGSGTTYTNRTDYYLTAMQEYNGKLCITGTINNSGSNACIELSMWDGISWSCSTAPPFQNGPAGFFSGYALANYGNDLYMGGLFNFPHGISMGRWNGTHWNSVDTGAWDGSYTPQVFALKQYRNKLFVGGSYSHLGPVPAGNIGSWNDTAWSSTGIGFNDLVLGLEVYSNNLYACGVFSKTGSLSVNNIAHWNGTTWDSVGSGLNNYGYCLYALNGMLYCGGTFDRAGGVRVAHIAQWDGLGWSSPDSGTDSLVRVLTSYNGELIAGGDFVNAGGHTAMHIARWSLTAGIQTNASSFRVRLYPNPSQGIFKIENSNRGGVLFRVFDLPGNLMLEQVLKPGTNQLDIGSRSRGIYLYQVIAEDKFFENGKLVIE